MEMHRLFILTALLLAFTSQHAYAKRTELGEYLKYSYTNSVKKIKEEALARKRSWCLQKMTGDKSAMWSKECEDAFGSPSFMETPAWCSVTKQDGRPTFGSCD